ncbi:hypothetical protein Tco_0773783 [Tanacetum coccineum]|uniref:DUF8040 domain-containing protein n=1 Tax=Tanacetum coccineum TaxID=301880 RepID=A0ABQ4ZPP2_9ASTR
MTAVEKLGIFVYTLVLGVSNRDVSEHFQSSGETISRAFHEILEAITGRSKGFHGLTGDDKPRDPTFFNQHHSKSLMIKDICRTSRIVLVVVMVTHNGDASQRAEQIPYM